MQKSAKFKSKPDFRMTSKNSVMPRIIRTDRHILIKNGEVVNDDTMCLNDVLIEDGIIKDIGLNIDVPPGTRIINAKNMMVIPGGIDTHTHFERNLMGTVSCDDFYSGTRAALYGGTTMIMDFAIDTKGQLLKTYDEYRNKADSKVCCDYSLHIGISQINENTENEMGILAKEKGVNSFKVFMCYDKMELSDSNLLTVFEISKKEGCIVQVHAENGSIIRFNQKRLLQAGIVGPEAHYYSRTEEVEAEATNRAITLANQINCPVYLVHVMSKDAANVIAQHKQKGSAVYGEVIVAAIGTDGLECLHHSWRHAASFMVSPPLNPDPTTSAHLLNLLSSGSLQTTGSNHCTFTEKQRQYGQQNFTNILCGVNGVEERMSVLWEKGVMTGIISPMQFVAATSSNAAKIFNIYPRKGRIQAGSDADVIVWDPNSSKTISATTHMQVGDFNIFEGMTCRGLPSFVISRGKIVIGGGKFLMTQGSGHFIPTPPFSPFVYSSLQQRKIYPDPVLRKKEESSHNPTDFPNDTFPGMNIIPKKTRLPPIPTKKDARNLQDSTFGLSGSKIDDTKSQRPCVRVNNPPGGPSSLFTLW